MKAPSRDGGRSPDARKSLLLFAICAVVILTALRPVLLPLDGIGGWDWTQPTAFYEAGRKSILEFGEYPWWNPYSCGGFPLDPFPNYGMVSLGMALSLVFGSLTGVKLLVVIHYLIGLEGARRLAGRVTDNVLFQYAGGLIYCLGGAFLLHTAVGHVNFLSAFWLPWICHLVLGLGDSRRSATGLGIVMGLLFLQGIHYVTIYATVIVTGLGVYAFAKSGARSRFVYNASGAVALFLLLSATRIITASEVFLDYPRIHPRLFSFSPVILMEALFSPFQSPLHERAGHLLWWELGFYLGALTPILFLASFHRGIRWYHVAALVCLVLAFDSARPYLPGFWVRKLPLFSSLFVITRWRLCAALFIVLGVTDLLSRMYRSVKRPLKIIPVGLAILIIVDLLFAALHTAGDARHHGEEELLPKAPPSSTIRNAWGQFRSYPAVKYGIGLAQGYQPMLGYDRARPTRRRGEGHPEYWGELGVNGKREEFKEWSPNRFVVSAAKEDVIRVNANPGSYWVMDGERLFPDARVAELEMDFEITAPRTGDLVFEIRPAKLGLARFIHLFAGLITIAWILIPLRHARKREKF